MQQKELASPPNGRRRWMDVLRVYRDITILRMLLLGFSSGLPLPLVLYTLGFRLREAGIDRSTIGYLSWVGLMYAFKWTWSPLVDRLPLPWLTPLLGRRRSWLLLAQAVVATGLVGMALTDPLASLMPLVVCTLLVAWGSATQDIALDAFRIESAEVERQAALAAAYQTGYRLALIWAGAGVLWIAARASDSAIGYSANAWRTAYLVMAASMAVGGITALFSQEPQVVAKPMHKNLVEWFRGAAVDPLADFFRRYGRQAWLILALVALYRVGTGDVLIGVMSNPFYVDMGYTKDEVAMVTKVFGFALALVGAFVGGALVMRMGVMRVLMLGAVLGGLSNLLFAWLATRGHDVLALVWVISMDNVASGMAASAFMAYLSGLTSANFTATQYALFSSLMMVTPKFLAGYSGRVVDAVGYQAFFATAAIASVPVLVLVWWVNRQMQKPG